MKTRYFIENTSIDYYGIRRRNVIIFSIVSGTFDSQIIINYIAFIFTYASARRNFAFFSLSAKPRLGRRDVYYARTTLNGCAEDRDPSTCETFSTF